MKFTKAELRIVKKAVGKLGNGCTDPVKLESYGEVLEKVRIALKRKAPKVSKEMIERLVEQVIDTCAEAGNEGVAECRPIAKQLKELASTLTPEVKGLLLDAVLRDVEQDRKGELESGWCDEDVRFLKRILK
jgi:hypothetical protein